MRKYTLMCLFILVATTVMGCGAKDSNSIVKDLSERSEEMNSYSSHGKLTIKSDQGSQDYDIEVWYKKPNFYRVRLKNLNRGVTQILLRNEQGVYVLTPQLKKSFRFQSNWPTKNSQVYLYQTVLSSIIDDNNRKFKSGKKEYQFEVAANYSFNPTLKTQQILLDDDLNPKKIEIMDEKKKVIVKMEFDRFKEDASFDPDSFDMQRNLNSLKSKETLGSADQPKEEAEVVAITPGFIPAESTLVEEKQVESLNGSAVIMRFMGKKPFTLTQSIQHTKVVSLNLAKTGDPVDLGETLGVMTDDGKYKKLSWVQGGTEFELQGNLSKEEIIRIATSTFEQPSK